MRSILKLSALLSILVVMSCSKEASDANSNTDQEAENVENTPLEVNLVSENVIIKGGTKNDGTPPTPNEAISLDLSGASSSALLNEGFKVPLNSDGAIVGAYIQFKAEDGTIADSYYDVDLSANSAKSSQAVTRQIAMQLEKGSSLASKEELELDVDFGAAIEPGTFCYILCVYDDQDNISAPQELCVTVESWGGFSAIVGDWNLVKEEFSYDGQTEINNLGDTECDSSQSQPCSESNDEFSYIPYCSTTTKFSISIKADGTYEFSSEGTTTALDYEASVAACEAVYVDYEDVETSSGNWAYTAESKELTVVEYSFYQKDSGEVEQGTWDTGNARLIFSGKAEVDGNSLVLSQDAFDEVFKLYLEK